MSVANHDFDVDRVLRELGNTADMVAGSLVFAGVKGVRCEHANCPVAVYLRTKFPGHEFEVSNSRVQIDGLGRAVVPIAVGEFVTMFDTEEFPELEAR